MLRKPYWHLQLVRSLDSALAQISVNANSGREPCLSKPAVEVRVLELAKADLRSGVCQQPVRQSTL